MLRPVLWFGTAYTLVIIFHEAAHALTGKTLGIPSTLFNFWVNHDFSQATAGERAAVGIAGPMSGLVIALAGWLTYRRVRGSAAVLPLAYLTAFGLANFFGNLMSAAFVGDFSNAAVLLGLTPMMRYTASVIGAVAVAAILFGAGRELMRLAPPDVSRTAAILGLIVLPAIVGTAVVIVINQPTPLGPSFASARVSEAAFWISGVFGMLSVRQRTKGHHGNWRIVLADGAVAVVAFVAVRAMARGILLR